MVLHKHGERLYSGLKMVVTEHLEQKVSGLYLSNITRIYIYNPAEKYSWSSLKIPGTKLSSRFSGTIVHSSNLSVKRAKAVLRSELLCSCVSECH